jgi:argininosuccinate lyase
MKGLPLAYNKDMQEDKEAMFDAADTVGASLQVTATVLQNLSVNQERAKAAAAEGYMNATELADYLVRKGMSFREAHDTVGRLVLQAIDKHVELNECSLDEMHAISTLIEQDVYDVLTLEQTLATKSQVGGTSREQVAGALVAARALLTSQKRIDNQSSRSKRQRREI